MIYHHDISIGCHPMCQHGFMGMIEVGTAMFIRSIFGAIWVSMPVVSPISKTTREPASQLWNSIGQSSIASREHQKPRFNHCPVTTGLAGMAVTGVIHQWLIVVNSGNTYSPLLTNIDPY